MGPDGQGTILSIAVLFQIGIVIGVGFLVFEGNSNQGLIAGQILITLICQFLLVYVALRDPGFINPKTYEASNIKAYEGNPLDTDPYFNSCNIYQFRHCSTCKIMRPPMSSHCKFCNVCVM